MIRFISKLLRENALGKQLYIHACIKNASVKIAVIFWER